MTAKRLLIQVGAIISIIRMIYAGNTIEINNSAPGDIQVSIENIYKASEKNHVILSESTIIEAGILDKKKYTTPKDVFVFVKDLSVDGTPSKNTNDVIIGDLKLLYDIRLGKILVYPYSEVTVKRKVVKKYSPNSVCKNIYMYPSKLTNRKMVLNMLKVAEKYAENEENIFNIENGIFYIQKILKMAVYRCYNYDILNGTNITLQTGITQSKLLNIGLKDSKISKLLQRMQFKKYQVPFQEILNKFAWEQLDLDLILERKMVKTIDIYTLYKGKEEYIRMLNQEGMEILDIIEKTKDDYNGLSLEEMRIKANHNTKQLLRIIHHEEVDLDSINLDNLIKMAEPWNRKLLELIEDRLKGIRVRVDTEKLENEIQISDASIIYEVQKERIDKLIESIEVTMLNYLYETITAKFMHTKWTMQINGHSLDNNMRLDDSRKENINTITMLIDNILNYKYFYLLTDKKIIIDQKKNKLISIFEEIGKIFIKHDDFYEIDNLITEKKTQIVDLLFKIKEENRRYSDLTDFKGIIKRVIEKIVDFLIDRQIALEILQMSLLGAESNSFIAYNEAKTLSTILGIAEEFHSIGDSNLFVSDQPKSKIYQYDRIFSSIRKALDSKKESEWRKAQIQDCRIEDIYKLYYILYSLSKNIEIVTSDDELWRNPVIMTFPTPGKYFHQFINTATIYYMKEDGTEHSKEVSFTNTNLKAFKEAKTLRDIESIESTKINKQ